MTGELHREHWSVPVIGLTPADPDGTVQAVAYRDGTVVLRSTCGRSRTVVRLDVGRAAQLSTGIWEAAGAALLLTRSFGDGPPPLPRSAPVGARAPGRQRLPSAHADATRDARRALGLRIRRLRHARKKSLRTISGLAGMSGSTLHRIEHGRRDLKLSEIPALAEALQTDPAILVILPDLHNLSR